jgi:hypothetical protein
MWRVLIGLSPITVPLPSPLSEIGFSRLGAFRAPVGVILVIRRLIEHAARLMISCRYPRRRKHPRELDRAINWTAAARASTPSGHFSDRRNAEFIGHKFHFRSSRRSVNGVEDPDEIKQRQIINGAGNDRLRQQTSQKGLREPLPVCRMETGG